MFSSSAGEREEWSTEALNLTAGPGPLSTWVHLLGRADGESFWTVVLLAWWLVHGRGPVASVPG